MKAKKLLMLVLDVIVVAILAISLMAKTTEKKTALAAGKTLLAENTDLSFDLIPDPEEKYVKAGETVEITLSVKNINIGEEGLNSIVGYLGYDENVFESMTIQGVGEDSDPNKWNIELNQLENHEMYGKFCIYTMQEGVTEDQAVVKMVVKLKDDLKPQKTEITFTDLASSDGEVEVPEEDRKVVLIIYEDEIIKEDTKKESSVEEVKTGDNIGKMTLIIIVSALTIILNILVFSKDKNKKMLSMILVLFVGLTSAGIISKAAVRDNKIDVISFKNNYSFSQNWLNSDKYLVTDETVSRIDPGKSVEDIKNAFNKDVVIKKEGNIVESGAVGTGMEIALNEQSKQDAESDFSENYTYEVSVWGDTNGDGKSNQVELTRIIRNIIDDEKWKLDGAKFLSADMKITGEIDDQDKDASVMYIVYGTKEIAGFDQVVEPTIEIIDGIFDEELNCYVSDVTLKITEQDENGTKTKYKVEDSKGVVIPFTEMNRNEENGKFTDTIILKKGDIYKISAYTYGQAGNRSSIPYVIVDGVVYKITYDLKGGALEEGKTNPESYTMYTETFTLNNPIKEDCNFLGWTGTDLSNETDTVTIAKGSYGDRHYEANWQDLEYDIVYKDTKNSTVVDNKENPSKYKTSQTPIDINNLNDVEGFKFIGWTLTKVDDEEQEVAEPSITTKIAEGQSGKLEYTANWQAIVYYTVTTEIVGGNGSIAPATQEVLHGANVDNIRITPDSSNYKVEAARVYTGPKDSEREYNPVTDSDGTPISATRDSDKFKITLSNVTEHKHVVVKLKETDIVAIIVAVPGDNDERLANYESSVDQQPVLNHTYETLEDALVDAKRTNDERDRLGLTGKVEIKIINDVSGENNVVTHTEKESTINEVILDLNSHQVSTNNGESAAITVNDRGSLQVIDRNREQTGTINNTSGVAIQIDNGGVLTLGENEPGQEPSITTPRIEGKTYGIVKNDDAEFNFYDGLIIGHTRPAVSSEEVTSTPEFYNAYRTQDPNDPTVSIEYLNAPARAVAMINNQPYTSIEAAVAAANLMDNTNPIEIDVIKTATITDSCTIEEGRNYVLDLNGHTVNSDGTLNSIINKGKFTIIDTAAQNPQLNNYTEIRHNENDEYYLVRKGDILVSNKPLGTGTDKLTHSYVEIDLENESSDETFDVAVTYSNFGDGVVLVYNQSPETPQLSSGNFRVNMGQTTATKTLQGGNKYYLHIFTKKADNILNAETAVISDITLNGETLVKELAYTQGTISATIRNNSNAELDIENVKTTGFIYNNGKLNAKHSRIKSISGDATNRGNLSLEGGATGNVGPTNELDICPNTYIAINPISDSTVGYIVVNNLIVNNTTDDYMYIDGSIRSTKASDEINNIITKGLVIKENTDENTTTIINNCYGDFSVGFDSQDLTSKFNINNSNITLYVTKGGECNVSDSKVITLRNDGVAEFNNCVIEGIQKEQYTAPIFNSGTMTLKNTTVNNNIPNGYSTRKREDNAYYAIGCKIYILDGSVVNGRISVTPTSYPMDPDYPERAEVIVGEKGGDLSTESPKIYNAAIDTYLDAYTISVEDGNVKFYDGQIIGKQDKLILCDNTEIEDGTIIKVTNIEVTENESTISLQKATLSRERELVAQISKSAQITIPEGITVEDSDDNYYGFYSLADAVKCCPNNAGSTTEIEVVKSFTETEQVKVDSGKNIIIDLNKNEIKFQRDEYFIDVEENSVLTMKDTGDSEELGKINTRTGKNISNSGELIVDGGRYSCLQENDNYSGTSEPNIMNTGNLKINNGEIVGVVDNTGTATMEGGKIYKNNSGVVINHENGSFVMNGGKLMYKDSYSGSCDIKNQDNATVTVNGGTLVNGILDESEAEANGETRTSIIFKNGSAKNIDGTGGAKICVIGNESNIPNITKLETIGEVETQYSKIGSVIVSNSINATNATIDRLVIKNSTTNQSNINNSSLKRVETEGTGTTVVNSTNITSSVYCKNGTLKISNGTIGEYVFGEGIQTNGESNLELTNVTLNARYMHLYDNSNITLTNVTPKQTNNTYISMQVNNMGSGNLYINEGTILNHSSESGVVNSGSGNVYVGEASKELSDVTPKIISNNHAVNNTGSGKVYFNNGILIGETNNVMYGSVTPRSGYSIVNGTCDIEGREAKILGRETIVKIAKNQADVSGLSSDDFVENGNYYEFFDLQKAVDSCKTNGTIYVIGEIQLSSDNSPVIVAANDKITLDLNGQILNETGSGVLITNKGEFTVTDSNPTENSSIRFSGEKFIENENKLTLNNVVVNNLSGLGTENNHSVIIDNKGTGTLTIDEGVKINTTKPYSTFIRNEGTADVNKLNYTAPRGNLTYYVLDNINGNTSIDQSNITCAIIKNGDADNNGTGNVVLKDSVVNTSGIRNYGNKFTIEGIHMTIRYTYTNGEYASRTFDYDIYNYSGDMVFKNSENQNLAITTVKDHNCNSFGAIFNEGGNIKVENGDIECGFVNNKGTVDIENGIISGSIENNDIFNIKGGTIDDSVQYFSNIVDGTLSGTGYKNGGINNKEQGKITIGNNGNEVDNNNPTITYPTEQITGKQTSELNIYDGTIVVKEKIRCSVTDIPAAASLLIIKNDNDTYTYKVSKNTNVAEIVGGNQYHTLEEAIQDCPANTSTQINMLADIGVTQGRSIVISGNRNVVINLNNKTIEGLNTESVFKVESGSSLTIKDADESPSGSIYSICETIFDNEGNLTISGGKYNTINKTSENQYIVVNNGSGNVTITGGTLVNKLRENNVTIKSTSNGLLRISGGTIKSSDLQTGSRTSAILIDVNDTEVIIEGNAEIGRIQANIYENINLNTSKVTIAGGTIQAERIAINYDGNNANKYGTVSITGGTIVTSADISYRFKTGTNTTVTIDDTTSKPDITACTFYGPTNIYGGKVTDIMSYKKSVINGSFNGKTNNNNENVEIYGCRLYGETNISNSKFYQTANIYVTDIPAFIGDNTVIDTQGNALSISGGTTTISGTGIVIKSANGTGLSIARNTNVILGDDSDNTISITEPVIQGKNIGIDVAYGSKLYWNDGVAICTSATGNAYKLSSSDSIIIPERVSGFIGVLVSDNSPTGYKAYLGANANPIEASIRNDQTGESTTFGSLAEAINTVNSSTSKKATIYLESTVYLSEQISIPTGCEITINLNGNSIGISNTDALIKVDSNATLTIMDSSTEQICAIENRTGPAIENNGTLNVNIAANRIKTSTSGAAITGTGTVNYNN